MRKPQTVNRQTVFDNLLNQIKQARQKAAQQVNTTLIDLYWSLGKNIGEKVKSEAWGKGVVKQLAAYIAENAPEIEGFSDKNLWRMKQFYETYNTDEKLSPLVRELAWSHNLAIFSRCKTQSERAFYLNLATNEKYSLCELDRQISACLFERTILEGPKISTPLRELQPGIDETFKDNYVLEFLGLPETHSELTIRNRLFMLFCELML